MADAVQDEKAALQKQIKELQTKVTTLAKSIAEDGADAVERLGDEAHELYEDGLDHAERVGGRLRRQARMTARLVRRNPGTAATVLSSAGLIGLAVGVVIGMSCTSIRRG